MQIGDVELSADFAIGVEISQYDDRPAHVDLIRHTADDTSMTSLPLAEARQLHALLGEALRRVGGGR